MLCPVDKTPMIVVEYTKIELDHCTKCRGVWFDAGELELLLQSCNVAEHCENILTLPEAKTTEKKRKCPICQRNMPKRLIGQPPDLVLDACDSGHGLWFDGGELHHFLKEVAGKAPGEHRVTDFIGEVFKALE